MPEEVLRQRWWIAAVAFGVALVATPIARRIARRARMVDRPDDHLKPHGRPTPFLGGLAICAAVLAGLAGYLPTMPGASAHWARLGADLLADRPSALLGNPVWRLLSVAAACLLMTVVGLLDDLREMPPAGKLIGQVAAGLVLAAGGIGSHAVEALFVPAGGEPSVWVTLCVGAAICVALVCLASNAVNLLDGMDGLCGGVMGVVAVGYLALSVWLAMAGPHADGTDGLRLALCLAAAGAVLGFLPYNLPPARIFMGDAGSLLLGLLVAAMMLLFCRERSPRWFVASWVIFAVPAVDTALAVVRRLRRGGRIAAGDRLHLYDQLAARGAQAATVLVLFYFASFLAAMIGVAGAVLLPLAYALPIYAALLAVVLAGLAAAGMVAPKQREPKHRRERAP